jgi:hypothetical protein
VIDPPNTSPILSRILKLRALSRSPNEYEAKAAKTKAEELQKKHGVADATILAAERAASCVSGESDQDVVYTSYSRTNDPFRRRTPGPSEGSKTPGFENVEAQRPFGYTEAQRPFGYTAGSGGPIDLWEILEFPGKNKKAWVVELASLLATLHECLAFGYQNKILAVGAEGNLDLFIAALDGAIREVDEAWDALSGKKISEASFRLGATHRVVERINVNKHKATVAEAASEAFHHSSGFFQGIVNAFKAGYSAVQGLELERVRSWIMNKADSGEIDETVLRAACFPSRAVISDEVAYELGRSE